MTYCVRNIKEKASTQRHITYGINSHLSSHLPSTGFTPQGIKFTFKPNLYGLGLRIAQ